MRVTITVNGQRHEADDVWEGESLLYVLRERMGLPGRRTPASRASAARAPSTSTASPAARAWSPPARPTVARGDGRGPRVGRRAAPGAAGVPRRRRRAVRLLHAGPAGRDPRPARPRPRPRRLRDPRGAGRQPVPLHGLREDHRSGAPAPRSGCDERSSSTAARWSPWTATAPSTRVGHVVVDDARIVAVGAGPAPRDLDDATYVDGIGLPGDARPGQHPPPPLPVADPRARPSTTRSSSG